MNTQQNQCNLAIDMQRVWLEHVWWTRNVILGIISDLPGNAQYTERLLQNPADMANVFQPHIRNFPRQQFVELFTTHLKQGGDIVTAAKAGNAALVAQLQLQWHANADQIAAMFANMSPCYSEDEVRRMMYEHLRLTTDEATQNLNRQYTDEVRTFDAIQAEALEMANYFTNGIIRCNCN